MSHHKFFFLENTTGGFSVPQLTVDFFFVISGYFLLRSMQRKKDGKILTGLWDLLWSRIKPLSFSVCFIAIFNFVCIALFIHEGIFDALFLMFRYWWYVLYLLIGVAVFYLTYRLLKSDGKFIVFLSLLVAGMIVFDYLLETREFLFHELTFFARTFGCLGTGLLLSYVPPLNCKKFNPSPIMIAILVPILFYMAYHEKTYFTCVLMIALFAVLVYFSTNVSVSHKMLDIIGQLSTRMYLYMAFITMIEMLGVTNFRQLFVIDVAVASLDLAVSYYRDKYKALKNQQQKQASEFVSATK